MDNARFMRSAAIWCATGSLLNLALGVVAALVPSGALRSPGMRTPVDIALLAMSVLVLAGLVGLARSGAAGSSMAGRVSLGTALLGWALFIPSAVVEIVGLNGLDQLLFGIGTLLNTLGMIGTGIAVLLVKRWQGWHAWTPLIWGLYPLVVLLPSVALGGWVASLGYGSWSLCSLLFSVALWQEAGGRRAVQPEFAS